MDDLEKDVQHEAVAVRPAATFNRDVQRGRVGCLEIPQPCAVGPVVVSERFHGVGRQPQLIGVRLGLQAELHRGTDPPSGGRRHARAATRSSSRAAGAGDRVRSRTSASRWRRGAPTTNRAPAPTATRPRSGRPAGHAASCSPSPRTPATPHGWTHADGIRFGAEHAPMRTVGLPGPISDDQVGVRGATR